MPASSAISTSPPAVRAMAVDLAESRARLAAIIDNAVDGIVTIDGGLYPHRQCGLHAHLRLRAGGDDRPQCENADAGALSQLHDGYLGNYNRSGEAKIIGIGREVEGRRKSGHVFLLDLAVAKVELNGATIYSGIVRDISERKASEQALIEPMRNSRNSPTAPRTTCARRSPRPWACSPFPARCWPMGKSRRSARRSSAWSRISVA